MEANPELANQFCLLYLNQGLLRGPCTVLCACTREDGVRCSPLADGAHDMVGTFPLVEPCVVAVPHQLTGLCFVSPHVLVEVPKVHAGELLQAQYSCTGHPPSGPTRPQWQATPSYPPWPQALGGHVHLSPNLDSWVR